MHRPLLSTLCCSTLLGLCSGAEAPSHDQVRALLARYCYDCHGVDDASRKADLNIAFFADGGHWASAPDTIEEIAWYVDPEGDGTMPPAKAPQPSPEERRQILAWVEATLSALRNADPDDPGVVPMARLTHATYDRVVRDLTGSPISVAELLPRDSAGGEGFTSSSANQVVTPELAEQWIEVAQALLRHARVSVHRGLRWQRETVPEITDLPSALAAYRVEWVNWHDAVEEHWAGQVHDRLKKQALPGVSKPEDWNAARAYEARLPTARYLIGAWRYRHRQALGLGDADLAAIALASDPPLVPTALERCWSWLGGEDFERPERRALAEAWRALPGPDAMASIELACYELAERFEEDKQAGRRSGWPSFKRSRNDFSGNQYNPFAACDELDLGLLLPADERSRWEEQARRWAADPHEILRLSAADVRRNARFDEAQWADYLGLIADIQQAHMPDPQGEARAAAALIGAFAARAWRGEPSASERSGLLGLYRAARDEGLAFEAASKRALLAILVSPRFLYRLEAASGQAGDAYAVDQHDLAERLSFAIWGSIPDDELLRLAADGRLADEAQLRSQLRRLLADPRSRGLAELFGAEWLHFADLRDLAQPDPERFPDFTDSVKTGLYAESVAFLHHLFQADRPLTDLVAADYTILNKRLSSYYDIEPERFKHRDEDHWERVPLPTTRSGILTHGSLLVLGAQPLRTSPVKRGAWLVSHLLGTPPPEPPPDVPELSADDVDASGLSIREQLALHRAQPSCAGCHEKIDPYGIALEHFDPAGRWRELDGAGRAVDASAELADGSSIDGVAGLRAWLLQQRQLDLMVRQFCRKLLGYAIGREVRVTDGPLLERMQQAMAAADWRVLPALEAVVLSRQFRYRRDAEPNTP